MSGLRPFVAVPKDLREWTRWAREAIIDGSVGTTQIEDNAVTVAKLAQLVGPSVLGNAANSTANVAGITASSNDTLLRRVSNALSFGALTAGMFGAAVVPNSALQNTVAIITTGSYTGTLTGCTTSPTATVDYRVVGGMVAIVFGGSLTATSNSAACTITGAPAALFPSVARPMLAIVTDNSVTAMGTASMDTAGVLTLSTGLTGAGGFTAANTKGIQRGVLVYPI